MYRLFDAFAHRYDLHTPPDHYQHDHELVLELAREQGPGCSILDIGCGTGVLVAKARRAGFDAHGIDVSPTMVEVARTRLPIDAVQLKRMQDLDECQRRNLVVALSWSIHYCTGVDDIREVLARMHRSLKNDGRVLLQVAHGPHLPREWSEDREIGPGGADDVRFQYRFRQDPTRPSGLLADYVYHCISLGEICQETHSLAVADLAEVSLHMRAIGFKDIECWNSWQKEPFVSAGSGFVSAKRP